jgi:hypothetical protein
VSDKPQVRVIDEVELQYVSIDKDGGGMFPAGLRIIRQHWEDDPETDADGPADPQTGGDAPEAPQGPETPENRPVWPPQQEVK